jgi:hypothetical protein
MTGFRDSDLLWRPGNTNVERAHSIGRFLDGGIRSDGFNLFCHDFFELHKLVDSFFNCIEAVLSCGLVFDRPGNDLLKWKGASFSTATMMADTRR